MQITVTTKAAEDAQTSDSNEAGGRDAEAVRPTLGNTRASSRHVVRDSGSSVQRKQTAWKRQLDKNPASAPPWYSLSTAEGSSHETLSEMDDSLHALLPSGAFLYGLESLAEHFLAAIFCCEPSMLSHTTAAQLIHHWRSATEADVLPIAFIAPVAVVEASEITTEALEVTHAVVAIEPISTGRILGFFEGEVAFSSHFKKRVRIQPQTMKTDVTKFAQSTFTINHLQNLTWPPPKRNKHPKDSEEAARDPQDVVITLDPSVSCPNGWIAEVNDVVTIPDERNHLTCRVPNLLRMELLLCDWPFVFLVACRDIEEGEELRMEYATDEWKFQREAFLENTILEDILKPISDVKYDTMLRLPLKSRLVNAPLRSGPFSTTSAGVLAAELANLRKHAVDLALALSLPLAVQPGVHGERGQAPVKFISLQDQEKVARTERAEASIDNIPLPLVDLQQEIEKKLIIKAQANEDATERTV
ncbi:hypothetical protein BC830DRAFT_1083353 [Chytriomyces sp. MP71]|nr:hypothetical protein BC830DRAFT_1083353 [Chytriomyces sp. MP71]